MNVVGASDPLTSKQPTVGFSRSFAQFVRRGAAIWVVVGLMVVGLSIFRTEDFWRQGNLAALLTSAVVVGIVSLGQHVVILSGGIDLAVGANVTLVTLLTAVLIDGYPGRTWIVVAGMLVLGLILGLASGFMVAHLNMPPFIVTLGMWYFVGGVALAISNAPAGRVTSVLTNFAIARIGPFPYMLFVLIGLSALVWWLLNRTVWGKQVFAVGGDVEFARSIGINAKRVLLGVYVLAGVLAGVAGILLASRSLVGSPTAGNGLELSSITAVVIGGTSLLGGKGALLGTMGGVALLALITNSITILQMPSTVTDLIRGIIILAAAAIFVSKVRR